MFPIMSRRGKNKEKSDSKTIHGYQNSLKSSIPVEHTGMSTSGSQWLSVTVTLMDVTAALTLYSVQLF